jgi:hypothetical protein
MISYPSVTTSKKRKEKKKKKINKRQARQTDAGAGGA